MGADSTPVTFGGVSPYLYYEDAGAALDWLTRVFGFSGAVRYVDDVGVVHEGHIEVGTGTVMVCGRAPEEGRGAGLLMIVHVDDVDAQHARVIAAGVEAPEPQDKPYGPRTFTVTDPWGYSWDFWQPVKPYEESVGGLREARD